MRVVLEAGVDPNGHRPRDTPIMRAVAKDDAEMVKVRLSFQHALRSSS